MTSTTTTITATAATTTPTTAHSAPLPTVASVQNGPGEGTCSVAPADYQIRGPRTGDFCYYYCWYYCYHCCFCSSSYCYFSSEWSSRGNSGSSTCYQIRGPDASDFLPCRCERRVQTWCLRCSSARPSATQSRTGSRRTSPSATSRATT